MENTITLLKGFLALLRTLRMDFPLSMINPLYLYMLSWGRKTQNLITLKELSILEVGWKVEWRIFLEGTRFRWKKLNAWEEGSISFYRLQNRLGRVEIHIPKSFQSNQQRKMVEDWVIRNCGRQVSSFLELGFFYANTSIAFSGVLIENIRRRGKRERKDDDVLR